MRFDPSRRLFLRCGGLTAVAPIVAPYRAEKVVKYFFAPRGGWKHVPSRIYSLELDKRLPVLPFSDHDFRIDFDLDAYARLVRREIAELKEKR